MNTSSTRNKLTIHARRSRGMTLLDVLLAIVVFVVGMLALASLQTNLTRSSIDANSRTAAVNLAEEFIEQFRTFEVLETEAGKVAYQDITTHTTTQTRGGVDYTIAVTVDDYYFMPDDTSVTKNIADLPDNRDTSISDFKYVELAVSWAGNEFQVGDGSTSTGRMGSGQFTLTGLIPSVPQLGSAKVAAEEEEQIGPLVPYIPGERPDIVAIDLNDDRLKESTTPMPDVIRRDELVETWFDVITYNTVGLNDSIFLRREEFLVVSCECELRPKPGGGSGSGFLPTIWNGVEYVTGNDGDMVSKAYGVSASNQQSFYCDTCCRDHHDPDIANPSADQVYDPARLASPAIPYWSEGGGADNNHKHYTRANKGGLSEATNNKTYVEACRMVRKDGFMRVAQDFRQEGLFAFPEGYLDTLAGANTYSNYVTDATNDFYAEGRDELTPPSGVASKGPAASWSYNFPADNLSASGNPVADATELPLLGLDSQQMRGRGIYLDHIGSELSTLMSCLETHKADPVPGDSCEAPGVTDPLQVLPFFDIQTTWLAWWNSEPAGDPVSLSNEDVSDNNSHSRALAVLEDPEALPQQVDIETSMHRGNIGLTVTDPITLKDTSEPDADAEYMTYLDVSGGEGEEPPPKTAYIWSGTFGSSVNKVNSADATIIEGGNTFCSRAGTSLSCSTPLGEEGSITISGYTKKQGLNWIDLWVCVSGLPATAVVENTPDGINNSVTITWQAMPNDLFGVTLSIEETECEVP